MNFLKNLPSKEHRGHIRRFLGLDWMTDEEDVALRGYVRWKRWNARLVAARLAEEKARPNNRRRG